MNVPAPTCGKVLGVVLTAFLLVLLGGCDLITIRDVNEDSGSDLFPKGTLNPEATATVLDDLGTTLKEVMPDSTTPPSERNLDEELRTLAAEVNGIPGIDTTIVHEAHQTATVVLENGLPILIINNRPSASAGKGRVYQRPADHRAAGLEAVQKRVTTGSDSTSAEDERETGRADAYTPIETASAEFPSSKKAVSAAPYAGSNRAAEIRTELTTSGYELAKGPQGDPLGASLADMRRYDDIGVLYLDTHGGLYTDIEQKQNGDLVPGEQHYGLLTGTKVPPDQLEQWVHDHKEALMSGRLVLSYEDTSWFGDEVTAKVAITGRFISRHWDLANGFALLHACKLGGSQYGGGIRKAVLESAAAVVGFDANTATSRAWPTIRATFNMLLGDRLYGRAWPLGTAREALAEMKMLRFPMPGNQTVTTTFFGSEGITLAPAIDRFEIRDDAAQNAGTLIIHGRFGSKEGVVNTGTLLEVRSWTRSKITARIPYGGVGSHGDLTVVVKDDIFSNHVPITTWTGKVLGTIVAQNGAPQADVDITVEFRGDVHRRKSSPTDKVPELPEKTVTYISPETEGTVRGHGTDQTDDGTVEWQGEYRFRILSIAEVEQGGPAVLTGLNKPEGSEECYGPLEHDSFFGGKVIIRPREGTAQLQLRMYAQFKEDFHLVDSPVECPPHDIGFAMMKQIEKLHYGNDPPNPMGLVPISTSVQPSADMKITNQQITVHPRPSGSKQWTSFGVFTGLNAP